MLLSSERRRLLAVKAKALAENVAEAQSYLDMRGLSSQVAEMFTLGCVPSGQEYAGRLSIPYMTPHGCVQIKYRCTDLTHEKDGGHSCNAKYLYEAGCGTHLYNASTLIGNNELVVLTEGELDAITVQAYCGYPAVGYPGVKNWKSFYRLCFESAAEVVVVADGDNVGRETARYISERIGMAARVLDIGDGQDANSFIQQFGATKFMERVVE